MTFDDYVPTAHERATAALVNPRITSRKPKTSQKAAHCTVPMPAPAITPSSHAGTKSPQELSRCRIIAQDTPAIYNLLNFGTLSPTAAGLLQTRLSISCGAGMEYARWLAVGQSMLGGLRPSGSVQVQWRDHDLEARRKMLREDMREFDHVRRCLPPQAPFRFISEDHAALYYKIDINRHWVAMLQGMLQSEARSKISAAATLTLASKSRSSSRSPTKNATGAPSFRVKPASLKADRGTPARTRNDKIALMNRRIAGTQKLLSSGLTVETIGRHRKHLREQSANVQTSKATGSKGQKRKRDVPAACDHHEENIDDLIYEEENDDDCSLFASVGAPRVHDERDQRPSKRKVAQRSTTAALDRTYGPSCRRTVKSRRLRIQSSQSRQNTSGWT